MKLNKRIIGIGLVAVAVVGLVACARGGRGGSAADSKLELQLLQIVLVLMINHLTNQHGKVFKLGVKLTNLKKIQVTHISNQTQNLILQRTCHQL